MTRAAGYCPEQEAGIPLSRCLLIPPPPPPTPAPFLVSSWEVSSQIFALQCTGLVSEMALKLIASSAVATRNSPIRRAHIGSQFPAAN